MKTIASIVYLMMWLGMLGVHVARGISYAQQYDVARVLASLVFAVFCVAFTLKHVRALRRNP